MERLWAPWRMPYIEQGEKTEGCLFCAVSAAESPEDLARNFVLFKGKTAFIMLNAYPYNPGHLMIAPYKHTADMYDLEDEELLELSHLIRYSLRLLTESMHPEGFNVGVNLGRTAGAGIADHVHWHIVPRWDGDTNFMPVIAGTKVLPESLQATYDKLRKKIEELGAP